MAPQASGAADPFPSRLMQEIKPCGACNLGQGIAAAASPEAAKPA
jgi:hypothetical protein